MLHTVSFTISESNFNFEGTDYVTNEACYKVFKSPIKNRWKGKSLIEIYVKEFSSQSIAYYLWAAKCKLLYAVQSTDTCLPENTALEYESNKNYSRHNALPMDHLFTGSEIIFHHVLVCEPCVPANAIGINRISGNLIFVHKPPGIPCYAQAEFQTLNLVTQLRNKHAFYDEFGPMSRLDQVTSGLIPFVRKLKFGGDSSVIKAISNAIKVYIADWDDLFDDIYVRWKDLNDPWVEVCSDSVITVRAPLLRVQSFNVPLFSIPSAHGTPCLSVFLRIDSSSKVLAVPITGKTHQLRVHTCLLQTMIRGEKLYKNWQNVPKQLSLEAAVNCAEEFVHLNTDKHELSAVFEYSVVSSQSAIVDLLGIKPMLSTTDTSKWKKTNYFSQNVVQSYVTVTRNLSVSENESLPCIKNLSVNEHDKLLSWHKLKSTESIELRLYCWLYVVDNNKYSNKLAPQWLSLPKLAIYDQYHDLLRERVEEELRHLSEG